jgi:hypothetical protein
MEFHFTGPNTSENCIYIVIYLRSVQTSFLFSKKEVETLVSAVKGVLFNKSSKSIQIYTRNHQSSSLPSGGGDGVAVVILVDHERRHGDVLLRGSAIGLHLRGEAGDR